MRRVNEHAIAKIRTEYESSDMQRGLQHDAAFTSICRLGPCMLYMQRFYGG